MTPRALHIVNESTDPATLFLPPLRERGFAVDTVEATREQLPATLRGYDAVVSCGGTANTHETDIHPWIEHEIELMGEALRERIPTIGICLGAQLLTRAAGGEVRRSEPPEVGWVRVAAAPEAAADPVLAALPRSFLAMQWHYYACDVAPGMAALARNPTCLQAFRVGDAAWGTQFHIEVTRDTLLNWQSWAPDELEAAGYPRDRFLAELERNLPPHEAIGRDLAGRFADVALARAENAA
jgi:GMP synthase (glutamine-hydrolysing)